MPLNVKDFGAAGNGVADDTAAIQSAITEALAIGESVFLPKGTYNISSPLQIGNGGTGSYRGFTIRGAARTAVGGPCGSVIRMTAAAQQAIITGNKDGAWRHFEISDLGLTCSNPSHPSYGILFPSCEISAPLIRRVQMDSVAICIGVLPGTGSNGEFGLVDNCDLNADNGFFYQAAQSANGWTFRSCTGGTSLPGAIGFNLNNGNGGMGLKVLDCSVSFAQASGIANSTLVQNMGASDPIIVSGGRYEHVTRLFLDNGGSPNGGTTIKFDGVSITSDFDPINPANTLTEAFCSKANAHLIEVSGCIFEGCTATSTFPVRAEAGFGNTLFRGCRWTNFAQPPYIITGGYDQFQSVEFRDCRCDVSGSEHLPAPIDRCFAVNESQIHPKDDYLEGLWLAAAMPGNLLAAPQIAATTGTVAPDAPWVVLGGSTVASNPPSRGTSPYARSIQLAPGIAIYQDLPLDLSTNTQAAYFGGHWVNTLVYKAKLTKLGWAKGCVSLVDSVSGQVYDEIQFNAGGPITADCEISLTACVKQTATTSYPRLKISNTDASNWFTFEPQWQYAGIPT